MGVSLNWKALKGALKFTDLFADSTGATYVGHDDTTVADRLNAVNLADYTALRAYSGSSKSVYVTGYFSTSAPSGIAGLFTRDDSDTTSADNGTTTGTVIVDALGRRWKRVGDGVFTQSGTSAVTRSAQDKMREVVSVTDFDGCDPSGASDSSAALRNAIAATAAGGTLHFPTGTYIVSQDGANVYCLAFSKRVVIRAEPGVEIKCNTSGVRSVVRFEAPVVSTSPIVVNGNNKANIGVEVNSTGAGTSLRHWESKNVTQQFSSTTQAACFRVASATGVTFDQCYAHDAVSYTNGVESDTAGAARGFLFDGTATTFGVNTVHRCRVDNIRNDRGLTGDYEDEDGIVSQMANSRLVATHNYITNCMKRGIKCQNPATVTDNVILSSRTLGAASAVLDGTKGMYGGISIYADDSRAERNLIASTSCFDGATGGSFAYGVEVGIVASASYRNAVVENIIKIGPASNARQRELISIKGAAIGLRVAGNKLDIDTGLTLANTYGIRLEGDHATLRALVKLEQNDFSYFTNGVYLRGGFSGLVRGNSFRNIATRGVSVDTHSYALSPKSLVIAHNQGHGFASNFTVWVNDPGVSGLVLEGNTSDSATLAPCSVVAGVRYFEGGSQGASRPSVEYGSAPPTSGTYVQGDIRRAVSPGPSAPVVEWKCTVGGTPGTWRQAAHLVGAGSTASRPTLTTSDGGVQYFDTTLAANGKPIWWVGAYWVDATGASV